MIPTFDPPTSTESWGRMYKRFIFIFSQLSDMAKTLDKAGIPRTFDDRGGVRNISTPDRLRMLVDRAVKSENETDNEQGNEVA